MSGCTFKPKIHCFQALGFFLVSFSCFATQKSNSRDPISDPYFGFRAMTVAKEDPATIQMQSPHAYPIEMATAELTAQFVRAPVRNLSSKQPPRLAKPKESQKINPAPIIETAEVSELQNVEPVRPSLKSLRSLENLEPGTRARRAQTESQAVQSKEAFSSSSGKKKTSSQIKYYRVYR